MIIIDKWGGLATNASPYAVPPGAAVEQVNLQCIRPGQIEGRPGLEALTLGTYTNSLNSTLISLYRIHGTPERVLAKDSIGRLYLLPVGNTEPSSPTGVSLAVSPTPPASVSLSVAPNPPAGLSLSSAPAPPTGATVSSAPLPPSDLSVAAVPQPPSSVGLLAAPTGLAVTT